MKKFLITGGFLFSVLPAMALNLSPLYKTTAPDNTGGCSGSNFQSDSVSMQAIYVTDSCDAGYYLDVDNNAAIDSTTGIITGVSCQPCTDGHYCSGVSDITLGANNSLTSRGETDCPAGTYGNSTDRGTIPNDTNDPDYNDIISKYTECQLCPVGTYASTTRAIECTPCANGFYASTEGNSTCTPAQAGYYALADHSGEAACTGATYASGTGNTSCTPVTPGWYANAKHSDEVACPTGYDKIAAASKDDCEKVISCPNDCSNFNHASSCSIDDTQDGDTVTFGNRTMNGYCFETIARNSETGKLECESGYDEENIYTWLAEHPESISASSVLCPLNGEPYNKNDPNYLQMLEDCSEMEPGTVKWVLNNAPMDEVHYVTACSDRAPSGMSDLVISSSTANITTTSTGTKCWMRNVDLPNQPWFYVTDFYDSVDGTVKSHRSCMDDCGSMQPTSATYLFGSEWPTTGDYAIVPTILGLLATATDGQNGNPSADVCVANTITINWGGIADPGAAGTCTYGEDFTAPTDTPVKAGYKFLGWTIATE